jgi:hypothetical protein
MKPLNEKLQQGPDFPTTLEHLNERSRNILRLIVEAYVETGAPIRGLCRNRRADRLAQPVAAAGARAVAGDDPQRHGGPGGTWAALRAPHLGRPPAHGTRAAAVREWAFGARQPDRGTAT